MSNTAALTKDSGQPELDLLEGALRKFAEASTRLEARHEALQQEIEGLRFQLEEKENEIKRSERLAMLGETAAAIAHEVRNPLGAIKLFLSLLRQDVGGNQAAVKMVDQIDGSITRLDQVVSNILHFSKGDNFPLVPVNLNAMIEDQIAACAPLHQGKAVMVRSLQGAPFVLADESALRQVLGNLLLNALQATHFTGTIEIETRTIEDGAVELSIQDNGPGIPQEMLPRVFEPFVTGRAEGTGLGLAIVRKLVSMMGGAVSVQNDNGAKFTIRFRSRAASERASQLQNVNIGKE